MTMIAVPPDHSGSTYPVRVDRLAPGEYVWRLTASNGRSIARSASTFTGTAEAQAALDALVAAAAGTPLQGTVGHRTGGWGWTVLDRSGRPAARSPRTFERHGSCARSLQRFRAVLAQLAGD